MGVFMWDARMNNTDVSHFYSLLSSIECEPTRNALRILFDMIKGQVGREDPYSSFNQIINSVPKRHVEQIQPPELSPFQGSSGLDTSSKLKQISAPFTQYQSFNSSTLSSTVNPSVCPSMLSNLNSNPLSSGAPLTVSRTTSAPFMSSFNSSYDQANGNTSDNERGSFSLSNSGDTLVSDVRTIELREGTQLLIHSQTENFAQKLVVFSKQEGEFTFFCELCSADSQIVLKNGSNSFTKCGHYIACNECRGRTVRRLLRCEACCTNLSGKFPVCGSTCINNSKEKETSNTGNCPKCDVKLRKEVCGSDCTRRKSQEYRDTRNELNNTVAVLVQNPSFWKERDLTEQIRPCSHYSRCNAHNTITKGHSKETGCKRCKEEKSSNKRNINDINIFYQQANEPKPKRSCTSPVATIFNTPMHPSIDPWGADFAEMMPISPLERASSVKPGDVVSIIPGDKNHARGYISKKVASNALWISVISSHPTLVGNMPRPDTSLDLTYQPVVLCGHCPVRVNVLNKNSVEPGEYIVAGKIDGIGESFSENSLSEGDFSNVFALVVNKWTRQSPNETTALVECVYFPMHPVTKLQLKKQYALQSPENPPVWYPTSQSQVYNYIPACSSERYKIITGESGAALQLITEKGKRFTKPHFDASNDLQVLSNAIQNKTLVIQCYTDSAWMSVHGSFSCYLKSAPKSFFEKREETDKQGYNCDQACPSETLFDVLFAPKYGEYGSQAI